MIFFEVSLALDRMPTVFALAMRSRLRTIMRRRLRIVNMFYAVA
jgi:hypothetical protein